MQKLVATAKDQRADHPAERAVEVQVPGGVPARARAGDSGGARACYVETMSGLLKQALQGHVRSTGGTAEKRAVAMAVAGRKLRAAAAAARPKRGGGGDDGNVVLPVRARRARGRSRRARPLRRSWPTRRSPRVRLPHEPLFRSSHKLLMDMATFEFLFCEEFFGKDGGHRRAFSDIARPAAAVMNEQMLAGGSSSVVHDLLRGGNHDVVGLVLMLRVNAEHQCVMPPWWGVPCLDRHLHGVELSLGDNCKAAFDAHLTSATRAAADPAKVARLWMDDTSAHPVARPLRRPRRLDARGDGDALARRADREGRRAAPRRRRGVLLRIAEKFADARRRAAFVVNCCDRVCAVLAEARVIGPLDGALAAVGGESLAGRAPRRRARRRRRHTPTPSPRRRSPRTSARSSRSRATPRRRRADIGSGDRVVGDGRFRRERARSRGCGKGARRVPPSAPSARGEGARSAAWRRCCRRVTPTRGTEGPSRARRDRSGGSSACSSWRDTGARGSKRRARTSASVATRRSMVQAIRVSRGRHVLKVL